MNPKQPPETLTRVQTLFEIELGLESAEITDDLTYGTTPEWDSVGHMHLIAAIEGEFGFTFEDAEISKLTTFALIVEAVAARVG